MIAANIDERLTTSQAARRASVTPETIRLWIHDRRLTAVRTKTGQWRIDPAELDKVLGMTNDNGGEAAQG